VQKDFSTNSARKSRANPLSDLHGGEACRGPDASNHLLRQRRPSRPRPQGLIGSRAAIPAQRSNPNHQCAAGAKNCHYVTQMTVGRDASTSRPPHRSVHRLFPIRLLPRVRTHIKYTMILMRPIACDMLKPGSSAGACFDARNSPWLGPSRHQPPHRSSSCRRLHSYYGLVRLPRPCIIGLRSSLPDADRRTRERTLNRRQTWK